MSDDRANNNFDLIRLLLAFGVLVSHSFALRLGSGDFEPFQKALGASLGQLCVLGFFALSGYMVVQSWQRDMNGGRFLVRRCARIFPGFLICSLLCALMLGPIVSNSGNSYWHQFKIGLYLFSLVNLHGPLTPPTFADTPFPSLNGSLWTIRLEFRCYLFILLIGLLPLKNTARMWVPIALLLGSAALFPFTLERLSFHGDYWTIAPIAQMTPLLFAVSIGVLFHLYRDRIPMTVVGALISGGLLCATAAEPAIGPVTFPLSIAYILIYVGNLPSKILKRLHPPWDVSYGMYLYAWPIQKTLLWIYPSISVPALIVSTLLYTSVVAMMSWRLIERPAIAWATRRLAASRQRERASRPAVSTSDPRASQPIEAVMEKRSSAIVVSQRAL